MGANNSKKSAPKSKKKPGKHKEPKPGQDIVRGQKIPIYNDDNANRLSSHITDNSGAEEYVQKHYGNMQQAGPTTRIYTDIPRWNPQTSPSQNRIADSVQPQSPLENSGEPESSGRHRLLSQQTLSSDEEYLDVPVIIRSAPETQGTANSNINTIKQAKVNVRDRVTFFKETNAPIIAVRGSKPRSAGVGGNRLSQSPPTEGIVRHSQQHVDILPAKSEDHSRRVSDSTDLRDDVQKRHKVRGSKSKAAEQDPSKWNPQRTPEPAIISDHRLKTATHRDDTPSSVTTEPDPDYGLEKDGGSTDYTNRMNTLEYFKQVPREHTLLRGFEKAKPAARVKKAKLNSPQQNQFGKPKSPRNVNLPLDNNVRPKSMFTDSPHSSEPITHEDGSDQARNSIGNPTYMDHQGLTSNTTGQRYASDDTEYETLTRKKQIAGQRLAVGVADKQTENNFFKSLQRNAQFKHAKVKDTGSESDEEHRQQVSDMVF